MTPDDLNLALAIYMDETFGEDHVARLEYLDRIEDVLVAMQNDETVAQQRDA